MIIAICIVIAGCGAPPEPPVVLPAPVPTAPPPTGPPAVHVIDGFPTPENTGVPPGVRLVEHEGDLLVADPGTLVEGLRVTGDIRVLADDVVIRHTEVLGRVLNQDGPGGWQYTIEESSVGAAGTCAETGEGAIGVDNFTALRVEVRGYSDGFRISGDDVLIAESFVELCDNPGAHADGVQGYYGGTNVRVLGNTIDARVSPENENAAIFFANDSRSAEVRDNLLMGGGFTLRMHDEGEYAASGNRIVDGSWGYAPISVDDCDLDRPIEWTDNRVAEIDGAYVVTATDDEITC